MKTTQFIIALIILFILQRMYGVAQVSPDSIAKLEKEIQAKQIQLEQMRNQLPTVNKTDVSENILNDLPEQKIIHNKTKVSFHLTTDNFEVNHIKQSKETHEWFKQKYNIHTGTSISCSKEEHTNTTINYN